MKLQRNCRIRFVAVLCIFTLHALGQGTDTYAQIPILSETIAPSPVTVGENAGRMTPVFSGQTYFVAPTGNDEHPGTEDQPWRTIQQAANVLQPGETVYIMEGVYREKVTPQNSGTDGQYIYYRAYPGHEGQVVLDGAGIAFQGGGLFSIQGKSFIEVSDLRVENSDEAAIYVRRSDHVVLSGNTTRNSESSGIGVWRSSHIIVDHNTVINARYVPSDQGGHEECITVSGTDTFEVRYNEVYHEDSSTSYLGGAGIDVKEGSSYGMIYGNYIHDLPNAAGIYIDAWDAYNHDHQIFQNLVQLTNGISIGSERGGTAENIQIFNNIVTRAGFAAIKISNTGEGRGGDGPRRNISIFNNTVYEARGHGGAGIYIISENVEDIIIKNNLVSFGWGNYGPEGWDTGTLGQITASRASILAEVTAEGNLAFGPEKCSQAFPECRHISNSIQANPLFVDRMTGDFHLTSESPAIDAGVDLSALGVIVDFDGISRPQGSGFDIGAYEYDETHSHPTFIDVPFTHPYHNEIEALYQAGYTAGCSTDPLMYCPDDTMIRAESAVFVERGIHGVDFEPDVPTVSSFVDVPSGYWGEGWIESLWADGYTAGCGTDPLTYCPLAEHTRAEGCVFYLRMMHGPDYQPPEPQAIFEDVPGDWWGAGWVEAAYQAGLIEPCQADPALRFCPQDPLTRGLAAYMMVQAKDLQ